VDKIVRNAFSGSKLDEELDELAAERLLLDGLIFPLTVLLDALRPGA
jgi:hypothetical protein